VSLYDLELLDAAACEEIARALVEHGSESLPRDPLLEECERLAGGSENYWRGVMETAYPRSESARVRGPWLRGPYRRALPRGERWLLRALALGAVVVAVRIAVGLL